MRWVEDSLAYAESNRGRIICTSLILMVGIALTDWRVQPNVSLGLLYIFPIVLAAAAVTRWEVILLSLVCTILREVFAPFRGSPEMAPRLAVVFLGFAGLGLLFSELVRNRRLVIQNLRFHEEAEQQLRVLTETSPLAILTLNAQGRVLVANASAHQLLGVEPGALAGADIRPFLPTLSRPLEVEEEGRSLRTTVECRGRRKDGEVFLAQVWFSTYRTGSGLRLAAVVWDASENLRDREDAGLDALMETSRILVGAVSHEVRNLAAAVVSAFGRLEVSEELGGSKEFQALGTLVKALEKIAASGLRFASGRLLASADLYSVLDEARIIMEPSFREAGISTLWQIQENIPLIEADRQSLLQVFLNILRNSLRAMEDGAEKQLTVEAGFDGELVVARFRDTGYGVAAPEALFRPFQPGAEEAGLGLYVSRAILRSHEGDLRYEPQPVGSCFVVELLPMREI